MTTRLAAALLAIAAGLPAQLLPEKYTLQATPTKGATVWFVELTRQQQQSDGVDVRTSLQLERTFTVTVRDVRDDGSCDVEVTLRRLRGTATLPAIGERTFDSRSREPRERALAGLGERLHELMALVDVAMRARVAANGKVQGALTVVADDDVDDGTPAPTASPAAHDTMRQLLEAAFGRRPDGQVVVGDTWQHRQRAPRGSLPLVQQVDVRLESVDDNVFETVMKGTLEKDAVGAESPFAQLKVTDGEVIAAQRVSRRDGFVRTARLRASATLTTPAQDDAIVMQLSVQTVLRRTTEAQAMQRSNGDGR